MFNAHYSENLVPDTNVVDNWHTITKMAAQLITNGLTAAQLTVHAHTLSTSRLQLCKWK